jgi:ferredoxin
MRVRVDGDACTGHGRCYALAPEVFAPDDRGHCLILTEAVPAEQEAQARAAEANCPERAISIQA